jgi:Ca2+-binding RTX toxin-like protein
MSYYVKVGTENSETLKGTDYADWINGHGGNDTLIGYDGDDILDGDNGADTVYGSGGNDRIYAERDFADDYLDGESGTDTIDYSFVNDGYGVVISLDKGYAHGYGIHDTLNSFENAVGTQGNDIIHGTESGFLGFGGNDGLYGEGGNDSIWGHSGDDWLRGGDGLDDLHGGDGNDTLHGDNDKDFLYGDAGDDWLYGDDGDDKLVGGDGDDHFDGGEGYDTVSYEFAPATTFRGDVVGVDMDHIWAWAGWDTEGFDTFSSVENVTGSPFGDTLDATLLGANVGHTIDGGAGNDVLYGANANDILIGGSGNDKLQGDLGVDFLTGGSGVDGFIFERLDSGVGSGSRDIITDFEKGSDYFQFYAPGDPLNFIGQNTFTTADQVRFTYDGSNTVVQVNFDTDATPEMEVLLLGQVSLTPSDFYFFS